MENEKIHTNFIADDTKPAELTPDMVINNPDLDGGGNVEAPAAGDSIEDLKQSLKEIIMGITQEAIAKSIPGIVAKVTIDTQENAFSSSDEDDTMSTLAGDGVGVKNSLDKTKAINDKYKGIADASKWDTITPYASPSEEDQMGALGGNGAEVKNTLDKTKAIEDKYKGIADASKHDTITPYSVSSEIDLSLDKLVNSLSKFKG